MRRRVLLFVLPALFLLSRIALAGPVPRERVPEPLRPWMDWVLRGRVDAFVLETAALYLHKAPTRADVLSVFAGVRPLVRSGDSRITAALSRDHTIHIDSSGLMTTAGGKWTTYRHMAEATVDQAVDLARLPERPCLTKELRVHGFEGSGTEPDPLSLYGSDAAHLRAFAQADPSLAAPLDEALPCTGAEVVWAARMEFARTVEDVLARRCRALFLNAAAAIRMAPAVAALLGRELQRDEAWQRTQVAEFTALAQGYMLR